MSTVQPGKKQGRKPVDLVAATGYRNPQDAAWEAIRELKTFTHTDVIACLLRNGHNSVNQETVKSYIQRLEKGNYIEVTRIETVRNNTKRHTYQLIKDVGIHAPCLKKDGTPSTQGMGRMNMWRSMKILHSFNYKELHQVSSTEHITVKPADAKDYIKHLYKAGYLQQLRAACQKTGSPAMYRLIPSKNTGPRPPMVQRIKQVFDPNLNKVMHREVPQERLP